MLNKSFILVGLLVLCCGAAILLYPRYFEDERQVFALVNGTPLFVSDLLRSIADAGGTGVAIPFPTLVNRVVQDMVTAELIYQKYRGEYKPDISKKEVVRLVLQKQVYGEVQVSSDDAKRFYEEHIARKTDFGADRFIDIHKMRIGYERSKVLYGEMAQSLRADAVVQIFEDQLPR